MKKRYFVYCCSFFFSLGSNILGFSLIYRLTDMFSFSPSQIGGFIALGHLFFFLGCTLYHRIGSIFDPIKVFPISAAVVFLASLLISYARVQGLVYVSYWILSIATGCFWPPVMAWLTAGLDEKELNRQMGLFNRSWIGANILGPLIAGTLYNWNSQVNFLILNISFSIGLIILYLLRRYSLNHGEPLSTTRAALIVGDTEDDSSSRNPRTLDRTFDLYRYRGWIGAFCSTLFLGVLANIVPLHIRDGLGFTERSAGLVLFLRSSTGFLGFAILARFTGWHFNRRWFYFLQAGLMLCSLISLAAGSNLFIFFGVAALAGFLNSGCYNNSMFYSSTTGLNTKKNMALHEIFLSLGNAAGSAGGGLVYQHFDFSGVCIALILALSIGFGIFILLSRNKELEVLRT